MWAGKWLTASILTQSLAPFTEAFASFTERSSTINYITGKSFSRLDAVLANVEMFCHPYFLAVIAAGILIPIVYFISTGKTKPKLQFKPVYLAFALIILMPIVWFFLTANHSYIHAFYTYRILGMSVFAHLSAPVYFFSEQTP